MTSNAQDKSSYSTRIREKARVNKEMRNRSNMGQFGPEVGFDSLVYLPSALA